MQSTGLKIITQFPEWENRQFRVNKWNSQFVESNVIINTRSSDAYFPRHWTPLSIKCAFNGAEHYITDRMNFRVDDSSFLVMNEGQQYESYIRSDTPVESFTICFTPLFVSNALLCNYNNAVKMLDISSDSDEKLPCEFGFSEKLYRHETGLFRLLQNIRLSMHEHRYDYTAYSELLHILLAGLISINKIYNEGSAKVQKTKPSTREELYKRLNIAKDYIDSCFNMQIELHDVSKSAGLSEHYMLREFKKLFNITPYQYLTCKRLEESKNLLIESNNSITQISILVGFEYLSSFTKLFTRRFNISPYKFREISS